MPLLSIVLMIWLTVVRHEGAHALMAWLQGVPLYQVRLIPGFHEELGFYFGFVSRGNGGTWMIDAAPFVAAVLWYSAFYLFLRRVNRQSAWWLPLFFIGLISPVADLIYNYQGGFWREGTDVWDLFTALPDFVVHANFIAAITLLVIGIGKVRSTAVQMDDG